MGIVEILGVAGSLSLLAGWRLYLTILATGVAMRFGWLPLPEHLQALQVLANRSEEHTSELQSLMRISYAVFCLKKKNHPSIDNTTTKRQQHTDQTDSTHI